MFNMLPSVSSVAVDMQPNVLNNNPFSSYRSNRILPSYPLNTDVNFETSKKVLNSIKRFSQLSERSGLEKLLNNAPQNTRKFSINSDCPSCNDRPKNNNRGDRRVKTTIRQPKTFNTDDREQTSHFGFYPQSHFSNSRNSFDDHLKNTGTLNNEETHGFQWSEFSPGEKWTGNYEMEPHKTARIDRGYYKESLQSNEESGMVLLIGIFNLLAVVVYAAHQHIANEYSLSPRVLHWQVQKVLDELVLRVQSSREANNLIINSVKGLSTSNPFSGRNLQDPSNEHLFDGINVLLLKIVYSQNREHSTKLPRELYKPIKELYGSLLKDYQNHISNATSEAQESRNIKPISWINVAQSASKLSSGQWDEIMKTLTMLGKSRNHFSADVISKFVLSAVKPPKEVERRRSKRHSSHRTMRKIGFIEDVSNAPNTSGDVRGHWLEKMFSLVTKLAPVALDATNLYAKAYQSPECSKTLLCSINYSWRKVGPLQASLTPLLSILMGWALEDQGTFPLGESLVAIRAGWLGRDCSVLYQECSIQQSHDNILQQALTHFSKLEFSVKHRPDKIEDLSHSYIANPHSSRIHQLNTSPQNRNGDDSLIMKTSSDSQFDSNSVSKKGSLPIPIVNENTLIERDTYHEGIQVGSSHLRSAFNPGMNNEEHFFTPDLISERTDHEDISIREESVPEHTFSATDKLPSFINHDDNLPTTDTVKEEGNSQNSFVGSFASDHQTDHEVLEIDDHVGGHFKDFTQKAQLPQLLNSQTINDVSIYPPENRNDINGESFDGTASNSYDIYRHEMYGIYDQPAFNDSLTDQKYIPDGDAGDVNDEYLDRADVTDEDVAENIVYRKEDVESRKEKVEQRGIGDQTNEQLVFTTQFSADPRVEMPTESSNFMNRVSTLHQHFLSNSNTEGDQMHQIYSDNAGINSLYRNEELQSTDYLYPEVVYQFEPSYDDFPGENQNHLIGDQSEVDYYESPNRIRDHYQKLYEETDENGAHNRRFYVTEKPVQHEGYLVSNPSKIELPVINQDHDKSIFRNTEELYEAANSDGVEKMKSDFGRIEPDINRDERINWSQREFLESMRDLRRHRNTEEQIHKQRDGLEHSTADNISKNRHPSDHSMDNSDVITSYPATGYELFKLLEKSNSDSKDVTAVIRQPIFHGGNEHNFEPTNIVQEPNNFNQEIKNSRHLLGSAYPHLYKFSRKKGTQSHPKLWKEELDTFTAKSNRNTQNVVSKLQSMHESKQKHSYLKKKKYKYGLRRGLPVLPTIEVHDRNLNSPVEVRKRTVPSPRFERRRWLKEGRIRNKNKRGDKKFRRKEVVAFEPADAVTDEYKNLLLYQYVRDQTKVNS